MWLPRKDKPSSSALSPSWPCQLDLSSAIPISWGLSPWHLQLPCRLLGHKLSLSWASVLAKDREWGWGENRSSGYPYTPPRTPKGAMVPTPGLRRGEERGDASTPVVLIACHLVLVSCLPEVPCCSLLRICICPLPHTHLASSLTLPCSLKSHLFSMSPRIQAER